MKETDIDSIISRGPENLERPQLEELVRTLVRKRDRAHIRDYGSHRLLNSTSLQERCQLIVGGLADKFSDEGGGYTFDFDAVGLYLPEENGDLKLICSHGDLREIIPKENPIVGYKEHIQQSLNGGEYAEIIIPLVAANKNYQGTILISNRESGISIDFKELYDFFHSYADTAAGAIYGGREHEKLIEETKRANRLTQDILDISSKIVHDMKNPLSVIGGSARYMLRKPEDPAIIEKNSSWIVQEVERMEPLVADFLDFTRIELGYPLRISVYNLDKQINSTMGRLEKKAEKRNMKFSYSPDISCLN